MFYYTFYLRETKRQISVEDILSGEITDFEPYKARNTNFPTRTNCYTEEESAKPGSANVNYSRYERLLAKLSEFNNKYRDLENTDTQEYYRSFKIPKSSGGYRPIDAPNPEITKAHQELKEILEHWNAPYHTAAYAYVKGRNPKMAVRQHQQNNSNWCLRTDFSNFFGSSTPEFVYRMLSMQYPYCILTQTDRGSLALKDALSLCFLRGGLPQGSVISPFITNLMMIPIDYELSKKLAKESYVYTRYADDIQISHYSKFDPEKIVALIDETLAEFEAPFRIKPEKTKFSSCAGINYMLGLDYNAQHNITVGHKRKRTFKAMVNNFMVDWKFGKFWNVEDTQYMRGLWSYYRSIEPDYIDYLVRHLEEKHGLSFHECVKKILKGEVK